jgi:hypothetical protein
VHSSTKLQKYQRYGRAGGHLRRPQDILQLTASKQLHVLVKGQSPQEEWIYPVWSVELSQELGVLAVRLRRRSRGSRLRNKKWSRISYFRGSKKEETLLQMIKSIVDSTLQVNLLFCRFCPLACHLARPIGQMPMSPQGGVTEPLTDCESLMITTDVCD